MTNLIDTIFNLDDVIFDDNTTEISKKVVGSIDPIDPLYCKLDISEILNLFPFKSWIELKNLYRFKEPTNLDDRFEFWGALPKKCLLMLLAGNLEFNQDNQVILASRLNLSVTQYKKNEYQDKVKVKVSLTDPSKIESRLTPMTHKKYHSDNYLVKRYPVVRDDGFKPCEVVINNDLQIRIKPNGKKRDPVVANILYRFLPTIKSDPAWHSLGVIRIAKKKLVFSSLEFEYLQPDIRLRVHTLLRNIGLIPNEVIKDSNLLHKGKTMFSSKQVQAMLKIKIDSGNNPTMPYTVIEDLR